MHVISASSVDEALGKGLGFLLRTGIESDSRNGPVIRSAVPVTTVYSYPQYRVLYNPQRDANPFFHLFESLWIVTGRQDVAFLKHFNARMAEYSDDGDVFHAPYGYRLRHAFSLDQIEACVAMLRQNPTSRQAVMQIWSADLDLPLDLQTKDRPCNDLLFLDVTGEHLNLTVCCRSNDVVWGAYGANAVQFSVLLEYLAARIGLGIGTYYQISNNYHAYKELGGTFVKDFFDRAKRYTYTVYQDPYDRQHETTMPLWSPTEIFNARTVHAVMEDTHSMFDHFDRDREHWVLNFLHRDMHSRFYNDIIKPMLAAHHAYKTKGAAAGLDKLQHHFITGENRDWLMASKQWLERRALAAAERKEKAE